MQNWQIVILFFSGLGIFNSLAFIAYLSLKKTITRGRVIFLQLLLFAFMLQVVHALLQLLNWKTLFFFDNLYLLGAYLQGPSMYLFIRSALNPEVKIWPTRFMVHFLPYLALGMLVYDFDQPGILEWTAIYLVGIQYLLYVLLSLKYYRRSLQLYHDGSRGFFVTAYVFPAFAFLWLNYPVSGITGINYQVWETILHSLFLYYLIILMIKAPANGKTKYQSSVIDQDCSKKLYHEIFDEVEQKAYFLDPELTMTKLARRLNLPVNTLSQVINQNSGYIFRDFINSFRIEMAKQKLVQGAEKGFTISSTAYECGFSSLSSFNRAFKKITGITPSEFLKSPLPPAKEDEQNIF